MSLFYSNPRVGRRVFLQFPMSPSTLWIGWIVYVWEILPATFAAFPTSPYLAGFLIVVFFFPFFFTFSLILNAFNIRQEKNPCIAAVLKIRTRNFFLYLDQELFVSNPDLERSCIRKLFRTMYGEILNQPTISANLCLCLVCAPCAREHKGKQWMFELRVWHVKHGAQFCQTFIHSR